MACDLANSGPCAADEPSADPTFSSVPVTEPVAPKKGVIGRVFGAFKALGVPGADETDEQKPNDESEKVKEERDIVLGEAVVVGGSAEAGVPPIEVAVDGESDLFPGEHCLH